MRQFELENKTTRDAFGAAVLELAKEDPTVIGIGADTTSNLGMKQMYALTGAVPHVHRISTFERGYGRRYGRPWRGK